MNILVDGRVLTHSKVTGVENHAKNIIKYIQNVYKVDVAIPKYSNKYYSHFWEHFILPIKARKYHLLFCPSNIAPIFVPKKVKLIVTLHDLSFKDFSQMYSKAFRTYYNFLIPINLKRANKVITISNYSKQRILKQYPFLKPKLVYIYHGVDKKFCINKNQLKENYILYIGSLNDTKNFSSVIKVFNDLKYTNIRLKMVMPKSENFTLSNENKNLLKNLKENVDIIDYTNQDNIIRYYQKAKAFIFPSYHESFGFPVLESFACGTPVLCSNTTALPEVAQNAALYCDPYNLEDIKNKLELLLDDTSLQHNLMEKGLIQAKKFSWEKSAKLHIALFKKVIDEA